MKDYDERFMREAIRQARRGLGRTSPNPAVGAVLVRDGSVLASGFHRKAGEDHAEIEVLKKVVGQVRGEDTLYVTLEPCNHHGKTPPCTEAILKSGIKRVVVGMKDPNPKVAGDGCDFLVRHGIEVTTGVMAPECRRLNEAFIKFVTTDRPFVMVKSALTLDGWTATSTGHSKWITNEKSRRFVHRIRARVDGIMVGIGTILVDDPLLTVRLGGRRTRNPVRIIVDTHLKIPPNAHALNENLQGKTIIAVSRLVPTEMMRDLEKENVSILTCKEKDGRIDLRDLLALLGKMSITSVLVEGGAGIVGSMIRDRLVDKFYIFHAPKLLGGSDGLPMASGPGPRFMDGCLNMKEVKVRRFDGDVLIEGYPE
jgi:diaminohydroxyphosphoribosylaminopyrimidine deaminase/5-amino-6-(5-phosphoribosylamino)uracil reductase